MLPTFLQNRPFLPLATERLVLRPLEEKDAKNMAIIANDRRVAQNLKRLPSPYTLEDAHKFITYSHEGLKKGTRINLAIIRREDQQFMGVIGLEEEMGYWLGQDYWGNGYGKEAAKALVNFAFLTLRLLSLSGSVLEDNLASRRIFEGLKFKQTGKKDCKSFAYEGTKPGITYALSRIDFLEHRKATERPIVWVAAAALINKEGKLLLAERPSDKTMAGVWEPPGGKIESGETPEKALVRELKEEIGVDVDEEDLEPFTFVSYSYDALTFSPLPSRSFHLIMPVYLCRSWKGIPYGAEGQQLAWVTYVDLPKYPLPPADILLCHQIYEWLQHQKHSFST